MMLERGPLILVDDDAEDQELLLYALQQLELNLDIKQFHSAEAALSFLYSSDEQPFMIVSDINMPKMDGITFKKQIDQCDLLSKKCIPFVFLSTSTKFLKETCDLNIQGYFEKGNTLDQLRETMRVIVQYWDRTKHSQAN